MPAGAYRTWDSCRSKADSGIHDVSAVAGLVANEAARVPTAGVAGDSVGTYQGVGTGRKVGKRSEEEGRASTYRNSGLEKQKIIMEILFAKALTINT